MEKRKRDVGAKIVHNTLPVLSSADSSNSSKALKGAKTNVDQYKKLPG